MLAGRRAAKILELPRHRYDYYTVARPVRPKGEISVLLDELESALEWALGFDATSMSQSPPPFETSGWESWPYVWSKRAFERIRPGRREALGAA